MSTFENTLSLLQELSKDFSLAMPDYNVFEQITVPQPEGPLDELYFRKLVSWSYVAIVEAFPIILRELTQVLKSTNSVEYKKIDDTKNIINALRTTQSHNLPPTSSSNQYKLKLVEAWKLTNQGEPIWQHYCIVLCNQIYHFFSSVKITWTKITSDAADKQALLDKLKSSIDSDIPPYEFDKLIEKAAETINLKSFNAVAYRDGKLDVWRKHIKLFDDIDSAKLALSRMIQTELIATYGEN